MNGGNVQLAGIIAPILGLAFWLLLWASICRHLLSCFRGIPKEFRKLRPGLVWLLLIPVFAIIWNFVAFPTLFQSYQCCLRSLGRNYSSIFDQILAIAYGVASAYLAAASVLQAGQVSKWGWWALYALILLGAILFRTSLLQKRVRAAIDAPIPDGSP